MHQEFQTAPSKSEQLPSGISYIIGNEAAERFSFYGMKGILVVFMTSYLWLMGGHGASSPMPDAEARAWYHLFTGSVYLTPFIGALIADAWLGKYRTIMLLSCVYCLGHGFLALVGVEALSSTQDSAQTYLILGLGTIALGSGGIKPCVSAHVGDQFGVSNAHWLPRVFGWFYIAINLGAFSSNLLTPWLLKWYGPHWAFGVPGVLMALATLTFFLGRKRFIHVPPQGKLFFKEAFGAKGLTTLFRLAFLYAFVAVFWALFDQTGSSWVLQAENMDRNWLGVNWLESQIQAINPIMILILVPVFSLYLYPLLDKAFTLTDLRKIGIGLFVMVPGFALVAIVQSWIDAGQRPSIGWQVLAYVILTASEVMVSVTCLEFSYTQSPRRMKSLVMATFLASVTLGNYFTMGVNWFIQVEAPKPSSDLIESIIDSREQKQLPEFSDAAAGIGSLTYHDIPGEGFMLRYGVNGERITARYSTTGKLLTTTVAGAEKLELLADDFARLSEKQMHWLQEPQVEQVLRQTLDPWGAAYQFNILSESHACLSSAGVDGSWNTPDDLNQHLYKLSAADKGSSDAWLEIKKRQMGLKSIRAQKVSAFKVRSELIVGGGTRLEGALYFWFFTLLMLATAICFIPFSRFYRPQNFFQGEA